MGIQAVALTTRIQLNSVEIKQVSAVMVSECCPLNIPEIFRLHSHSADLQYSRSELTNSTDIDGHHQ